MRFDGSHDGVLLWLGGGSAEMEKLMDEEGGEGKTWYQRTR
jgi:hypothetical protein